MPANIESLIPAHHKYPIIPKELALSLLELSEQQSAIANTLIQFMMDFQQKITQDPILKFLSCEFMIAGGVVRDLLLGKSFKDVDLIFSATLAERNWAVEDHIHPELTDNVMNKAKSTALELNLYTIESIVGESDSDIVFTLIKHVIKQHYNVSHSFNKDTIPLTSVNMNDAEYLQNGINGILKINSPSFPFDLDLIFVTTSVTSFIENEFDYSLCKTGLKLQNKKTHSYISYEDSQLFNYTNPIHPANFFFTYDFLHTLENKEIIYNVKNLSDSQVENSMLHHLKRILKKYPDYSVKLVNGTPEQEFLLEKTVLFHRLSFMKDSSTKSKTVKI